MFFLGKYPQMVLDFNYLTPLRHSLELRPNDHVHYIYSTPWKSNIAPENKPSGIRNQ